MIWIIVILGSGFFFSLNHIARKKILEESEVIDMMIFTGSFGFITLLPFFKYVDYHISSMNLFLIFLNTIFALGGSFLLNIVYKNCEISTVSPFLNLSPLFVILLSYFVLGEVLNGLQFVGVLLILTGGYIVTLKDIKHTLRPFTSLPKKYFLSMLSTLVLWSFCPILNRVVLLKLDTFSYMFYFAMFIFLIQLVLLTAKKRLSKVAVLVRKRWHLLIMASLLWIISDLLHLFAIAIPTALVSLIIPVKRISNLMTIFLGGTLFEEKNLLTKSTACAIMLTGLFVIGIYS